MNNCQIYNFAEVTSSQAIAWEMISKQADSPRELLIIAAGQTQGRGRGNNRWNSPANTGNLYLSHASIRLRDEQLTALGLIASIALGDCLATLLPELASASNSVPRLLIKWPNDVLIDHKKIAGVLVEHKNIGQDWMVTGIGCNINQAPATAISLRAITKNPPSAQILATAWRSRFMAIRQGLYRQQLRLAELLGPRLAMLNQKVELRIAAAPQQKITGTVIGVADDGALNLRLPSGKVRAIYLGEIVNQTLKVDSN